MNRQQRRREEPAPLALLEVLLRASLAAGTSPDDLACGLRIVAGEPAVEVLVSTRRELLASLNLWPSLAARLRALPSSEGFPLLIVTLDGMRLSTIHLTSEAWA